MEKKKSETFSQSHIIDDENNQINVGLISTGSAIMAGCYEYFSTKKSNQKISQNMRITRCFGAGVICYFMTKIILNNVNQI